MNEELRRSAAHILVDDIESPELSDDAAHHVLRVLRVGEHETVTVTDGHGRWRACHIVDATLRAIGDVVVVDRNQNPSTIAVAVPKQDRPEWLVQKATELGIDRIVFLHAERSIVRWDGDRGPRHVARLSRVAAVALMQSRRVWLPVIAGPVPASDVLPGGLAAEPGGRAVTPSDRLIAIGPEGGWTPGELALAQDRVGLGDAVLRVETAALVACVEMRRRND
ncbi:MAG TPA: RsmE family RNA methyltransferase [Ilumatobacteraceae bacterium]|nr:RsmE family RNA methyltransferase [Ilumatobacteraceae bacterium]